jgi:hypothetical protein
MISVWSVPRGYPEDNWGDRGKIMMRMFAILDKANPDIESIRGLNVAAVKHTTVQVTRLPL